MSEKTVCRFCGDYNSYGQTKVGMSNRKSFTVVGSSQHYAPDRPFRVEHILLDVSLDPREKALKGTTVQKIKVIAPHQTQLKLDQIGLQIEEVKIGSEAADFSVVGESLVLVFPSSPKPGDSLEITIRYSVTNPRRGLYFTGPDADYPHKPYQAWTQGQDEDSRYWFPTLDYPNQKATSEVIATVPTGFTAISNGALLSKEKVFKGNVEHGTKYHYRLGTPHVTYLVTLVVGEFAEWSDSGPRGLPVQYFVAKGLEKDGKRAFSNTPKMIEVFEQKTGISFPYEKYSQVAVQDFIFGGMENTSATTQTELTLHDEKAHIDFSSDPLVSHELAHQWFGDLVTCRDWSHGWLNEGFATFMERVWVESDSGPNGGFEEAKYYSYQDLKEHMAEDHKKYRRPIVCGTYIEPIDLFDTHLYQKGGLVLNLVRHVLGEDLFWKSIQLYLTRHRGQNVETLDLIRAIEDSTGQNLRRFFDEWVFSAGYPEFEVSYQWHEDKKLTEWVIEQKQTNGAQSITQEGATTPLFHLPVTLELTLEGGEKLCHRIEIGEARERVFLSAPRKPLMVRFDPDFNIPKTLKFPRPKEMLLYQLKNDKDGMGRIEAAQELGKGADTEVIQALGACIASDPFWAVQAEVAQVLAEIRVDASRDALIAAMKARHPKARRAIANALGTFHGSRVADALKKFSDQDESYFVEADATYAWATSQLGGHLIEKTKNPVFLKNLDEIEKHLLSQLKKSSYRDVIRASALSALSEFPGLGAGERPHLLSAIMEGTNRGYGVDARSAAVRALGKVLKTARVSEKAKIIELFSLLADEDNFRLRVQLVATLEETGLSEGISILSRIRKLDSDGRVTRAAQRVMDYLTTAEGMPDTVLNLKSSLEKLEEDYRKLRSMIEERGVNSSVK